MKEASGGTEGDDDERSKDMLLVQGRRGHLLISSRRISCASASLSPFFHLAHPLLIPLLFLATPCIGKADVCMCVSTSNKR